MRAFAEYVMRGRRQAIIIVLLCGFFPMLYFVSAAVVALVNLRKGWYEGFLVWLWSLLPAAVLWSMGDPSPAILTTGCMALALMLRRGPSWERVVLAATALGVLVQFSLILQDGYVAQVQAVVSEVMEAQMRQGAAPDYTAAQLADVMLRFYGAYHALAVLLCLMLGRWWQALLYNPGGFGREFRALRFDPRVMLALMALIVAALLGATPLVGWVPLLSLPPMLGGLAAMHALVALRNLGGHWLALGYLTLVLMYPLVIVLGLIDSVFDLRKRIGK